MSLRFSRLVVLLWTLGTGLYAKCPNREAVYQQVSVINAYTDNQRIIDELNALRATCYRCHMIQDSVYAKILHVLGRTYWYMGNLPKGITFTRQAIFVNSKQSSLTNRANLVHSYYNLGRIYADQNKYSQALNALDSCVLIAKRYPHKLASGANAFEHEAYIYFLLGDYEKAVNRADEGAHMAQLAGDPKTVADNLSQKAQALIPLNQLPKAEQALIEALRFAKRSGDPSIVANVYSLLASVGIKQQQYANVVYYYQQAFDLHKQANFRYGCVQTLNNLGQFYAKQLNQNEKALSVYKQAYTFCDDATGRMVVLNNIGHILYVKKQFRFALAYYQQALCASSLNFTDRRPPINPVADKLRVSVDKEYMLSLIQDKADTWLDYAKATDNNRQRLQYALDTYKVADQMIDFMRWEHTGQLSKFYWRQKTRGLYERAIETCYRLGDTEQAFRFLEKSRAVMLADKLNELGARQQLAPQQIEQEQRLRQSVSDQQAKLAGLSPDSASYAPARTVLMTKQDSLDTFLKQLEASNPAYYRYKYDNTTTSLATLQQHLKKQQSSLVTYFVGDSALYVMGVTGDTVMLKKQSIGDYSQTLSQFAPLLANAEAMRKMSDFRRFLVVSNSLFRQLLAPLALPKGRVVVSPDGFFIPFDALSRSANRADYTVNDYAFSYAYSASLLLKNGATKTRLPSFRTGDFLGVAPVDFAPTLKQVMLSGSDKALTSIAERFDSPMLLTHKAATRRAFQQEAPGYPVVLLFTHATADSTDQEPTLYFADSTLRLSDLGDRALPNAQLVVLAACKTGIGANQQGEGVFSLARGFSALGVPSVLTTLWSVENKATYQLTALFYKYLDDGFPKDIALQRAKQDWLKTADGANQLPNYWAGLIIVGDTEPLSHANYWLWIATGIVLLLAGLGSWWYYRKRRVGQSRYAIA